MASVERCFRGGMITVAGDTSAAVVRSLMTVMNTVLLAKAAGVPPIVFCSAARARVPM